MLPILLVPGLNADARVFAQAMPALWPHGPVMIANHLQGEGVAAIAANILAGAPAEFALGGFSFGGYLSFELLRQARERVRSLLLIDTTARPDTADATEVRRRRIEHARAGKFGLVIEQSFASSVHPENQSDSRLYAIHRAMAEANGPEVYVRHQLAIIDRPDSRPLLGSIGVPTLIVVGEADEITPPDAAREMHNAIAGSRLEVIPGAGHFALLENPERVNAALRKWAGTGARAI
ncbi:MAG TPA: alpha/beta fold hydrolase [Devosia sp.]|nr:alpha/beta fold hydrolase [Devosia sp.]